MMRWWVVSIVVVAARRPEAENTPRRLIIGGHEVTKGRYPYFVSLNHFGGGALIAPDIILTAGHCKPHWHDHVRPRIGTFDLKHDRIGDDVQERSIVDMRRHPEWLALGEDDFVNDFSILQLDRPVLDRPTIRLNRNPHVPAAGQSVVAMGLGNTNPDYDSRTDRLRQVSLEYLPNGECARKADPERNLTYENRIDPSMLCTVGGPRNERDACSYDSGSPIIIKGRNAEDDLLVALVSWGERCADEVFPGVNARVSFAAEWIEQQVCLLSAYPPAYCFPPSRLLSTWRIGLGLSILLASLALVLRAHRRRQRRWASDGSVKSDSVEQVSLVDLPTTDSESDSYGSI